jgi:predicted ATPase
MLKKIKLLNYTTFISETTINFSATNYKILEDTNVGKNRILKGGLFVGENASGKTHILNSIKLLLDLLFSVDKVDLVTKKSFYTNQPTYKLEYEFDINDTDIIYTLELSPEKVISEKLAVNKKIILERLGKTAKTYLTDENVFDKISENLLYLRLFYHDTQFYNDETLTQWYKFMENSIYINCYNRQIKSYSGNKIEIHDYLSENSTDKINKFLKLINYKHEIDYTTETKNDNDIFSVKSNDNKKFISFKKTGTKIYVPEMFESTGNITLMQLIPTFLFASKSNCMIILDEFSSGFHNVLEECLIKYFFSTSKNSQLFFASHSTNILNNALIRPDQIFSVTFDPGRGSILRKFSDEMPRESQNTEKMYLNGVFDGLPKYTSNFKD